MYNYISLIKNKENTMKKIFLLYVAMISFCFAELRVDTQEKKIDINFFIGAGVGVGANGMKFSGFSPQVPLITPIPSSSETFASFVASLKAGVDYFFTPTLGLRGYYNLDWNVLPTGRDINDGVNPAREAYIFSTSHTINADVIANVFSQNNMDIALIGGIGLGALVGELYGKYKTLYQNIDGIDRFLDFEFRFNFGARVLFDKKYGLELMAKIPVTSTMVWTNIPANEAQKVKYSPYSFTLDFVMQIF